MKIGFKCTCKEGFILAHDNKTCHGNCFNVNLLINQVFLITCVKLIHHQNKQKIGYKNKHMFKIFKLV